MKKKIIIVIVSILVLLTGGIIYYLNDYYHADETAIQYTKTAEEIDGNLYFEGENKELGFIIYPGGKVESSAYSVLASKLNSYGYTTVIAEFPFNLGILNTDVANDIIEEENEIEQWVIIGHSLGGVSASMYAQETSNILGITFLASYPYEDLSKGDLKCLSIIASEDKVLVNSDYQENKDKFPSDFKEVIIDGGNHSGFGYYGQQKGDGESTITTEEQHDIVVSTIIDYYTEENSN